MSGELIHNFKMSIASPECHPNADWFTVTVDLEDDISEVLPYLNAELAKPTDYRHKDRILLWKSSPVSYAFRSKEIVATPVSDYKEAQEVARNIIDKINDIWKRKDETTPDFTENAPLPNALDIFRMLPRTNCKKCGFPTCLAFSTELRADFEKLSLCPYLSEDDFKKVLPERNTDPLQGSPTG